MMTATKFITFGIGCLLLLPFMWSFVLMVRPSQPLSDEEQAAVKVERARMETEEGVIGTGEEIVTGYTSVTTYRAVTPHYKLASIWLLAPRWWVGVAGLTASLILLFCLFVSCFYPIIEESFGYEHRVQIAPGGTLEMRFQTDAPPDAEASAAGLPKTGD